MSFYLQSKLKFTPTAILDPGGQNIMMEWEGDIMDEAASIICEKGGDILNIGYGMGFIDNAIQSNPNSTHWIIGAHPDVQNKMKEEGWLEKPNVKCIFQPWQEVIDTLPKFDGVYYDTWEEPKPLEFFTKVHNIVKPGGIFSFFNNPALHRDYYIYDDCFMQPEIEKTLKSEFEISFKAMRIIKEIPLNHYWPSDLKAYFTPICIKK